MIASISTKGGLFLSLVVYTITELIHSDLLTRTTILVILLSQGKNLCH